MRCQKRLGIRVILVSQTADLWLRIKFGIPILTRNNMAVNRKLHGICSYVVHIELKMILAKHKSSPVCNLRWAIICPPAKRGRPRMAQLYIEFLLGILLVLAQYYCPYFVGGWGGLCFIAYLLSVLPCF